MLGANIRVQKQRKTGNKDLSLKSTQDVKLRGYRTKVETHKTVNN